MSKEILDRCDRCHAQVFGLKDVTIGEKYSSGCLNLRLCSECLVELLTLVHPLAQQTNT